jgi:hypothetical protein
MKHGQAGSQSGLDLDLVVLAEEGRRWAEQSEKPKNTGTMNFVWSMAVAGRRAEGGDNESKLCALGRRRAV